MYTASCTVIYQSTYFGLAKVVLVLNFVPLGVFLMNFRRFLHDYGHSNVYTFCAFLGRKSRQLYHGKMVVGDLGINISRKYQQYKKHAFFNRSTCIANNGYAYTLNSHLDPHLDLLASGAAIFKHKSIFHIIFHVYNMVRRVSHQQWHFSWCFCGAFTPVGVSKYFNRNTFTKCFNAQSFICICVLCNKAFMHQRAHWNMQCKVDSSCGFKIQ